MRRRNENPVLQWAFPGSASVGKALEILGEAYSLADDLDHDPWQFAVELSSLIDAGISRSVCRWLIAKGYVEHREESAAQWSGRRSFKTAAGLSITASSCFVITNAGIVALQSHDPEPPTLPRSRLVIDSMPVRAAPAWTPPIWNGSRKELLLNDQLVKRFRLPAPNQELILQAFQEDGWTYQIDDPLPQHCEIPPKQRLHDTIKALNHNQMNRLIQFSGNGRGNGICWRSLVTGSNNAATPTDDS